MNYQMETILRDKGYRRYNSQENPNSRVFVVNTEESNIKYIARDNLFLDKMFIELIENYDFDIDNAAIYYIFDRDSKSNTDASFIRNMLSVLTNSRDNQFDRQGMLLLSYPSIEAFTLSNFKEKSFDSRFDTGEKLKKYLHDNKINHSRISEQTLKHATMELIDVMKQLNLGRLNIDFFGENNIKIFDYEEEIYNCESAYRIVSLLCISLIDLGIISIEKAEAEGFISPS